jgi:hypothetical protein
MHPMFFEYCRGIRQRRSECVKYDLAWSFFFVNTLWAIVIFDRGQSTSGFGYGWSDRFPIEWLT